MGLKQVPRGFMGQKQRSQALKGRKGRVKGGKYDIRGQVEGLSKVKEEIDRTT